MSFFSQSPWILHYDASSCNGCDIEVLACLTPLYDVERFGVVNTGNPKHADILLITGSVNERNIEIIENLYRQMPEPKVVVAVGACACSGGIFARAYNIQGGVDKVLPVDVYVPGCAARPESIIDGVVQGISALEAEAEDKRLMERDAFLARVGEYHKEGRRLALINVTTLVPAAAPVHGVRPGAEATAPAVEAAPAPDSERSSDDRFEITWAFENDKDQSLETIREVVAPADVVPSISAFFGAAFLYENEMRELFGINVDGINVDLLGALYKTATRVPFSHAAVKARLEAVNAAAAAKAAAPAATTEPKA